MALTRPRLGQIYTNITALTDAISVLNAGASQANVDVGFLVNRAHGLVSNAAIYYSETLDTFVTAFTSNSGGTDSNIVISSFTDFTTGNVFTTGLYWNGNGQPITFTGGGTYSNVDVAAYLLGNVTTGNISAEAYYFANGMPFVGGGNVVITNTYSNVNVAAYLLGNVTTGNINAEGYYFANGMPFISGSNYGNIEVSAFLPTYTGDLYPGNITASGNIVGGGVRTTTSATPPTNPVPGDMWYDTATDTLFRFTDLGTSSYWLDTAGQTISFGTSGNVANYGNTEVSAYLLGNITTGNISAAGYYFANGTPFISGSNYGNVDVSAYLDPYFIYANANAATQQTAIDSLNANIGAYQTYANANAATQQTQIDSIDANIGSYQIYANANAAAQTSAFTVLDANVGAYQIWANVEIGSKAPTESPTFTGNAIMANLTVGNLVVQGNTTTIGTSDLTIQDSIIHLHTFANLAPLSVDDGRDIGLALHYYKSGDGVAFLGWANDSGYLEYYAAGSEVGNVFTGTAYGTIKAGGLLAVNSTASTSTTTGALVVSGGAGIAGNLFANAVYSGGYYFANGTPFVSSNYGNIEVLAYLDPYFIYANSNAASQQTAINTVNANIGSYQTWANATFTTYSNTNVAGYLAGNITTGNVSATGYYFANGAPFTSSNYGNANVAAYLPTYTGNLSAGNIVATGNIVGGGVRYTTSATPPTNPVPGDSWFDTTTDTLLRYVSDGVSSYWVDYSNSNIQLQTYGNTEVSSLLRTYTGNIAAGNISVTGQVNVGGTLFVSSNIIPTTSNTLNIGSNTNRFGSLFLSGNTIYLGNAVITENTQLGTITFIPSPTIANPNPTAIIFTSNGGITAVQTISGNVTSNTITPTFANLTATSIYSNSYFYANGTAFVGGTGGTNTGGNGISVGYSFSGNTANNTETELFVDGVNNSRYTVPANSTVGYEISIVGRKSDGAAHAYYKLNGLVANTSGNVSDVGSIVETIFTRTYADWLVDARADNTNKTLNIYVQGSTSNTISWSATMTTTKAS